MSRKNASRLNVLFNRVSLPPLLLFFLGQVNPALGAQDKEWGEHMKAGDKASLLSKYEKAEKEFQAALARTLAFPPSDLRTAETLSKIAFVYLREHKYSEAETRQKQAVAIIEPSAGPDDPRFARAMNGLALVYEFEGKREEAAPIWDRYFPILQKPAKSFDPEVLSALIDLFGPDGIETGGDAQLLGRRFQREGRYGAAYPFLLRSLEISRKAYAKDRSVSGVHRDSATAWDAAVAILELPLFHENVPGPFLDAHWGNPYQVFLQYKDLAQVAAASGKYSEAEQLYKQIISMEEKDASSNKKFDITSQAGDWVNLSRVYRHEHRYNDALDALGRYKVVDEMAAKVKFADPRGETLLHWYSQNELAEIYREKGDLAAARPFFEQSMEMMKTISLGERHPRIAELQSDYAAFLADEGKFDEAESSYKRALDTWAHRYDWNPDQLEHAEALANYAALLRKLNRPAEAEPMETQASGIREMATGSSPAK
jgi:tetratricopeptide (TPR) repeat protein